MRKAQPQYPQKQQGALLVVSILLLFVLTLVSVSSITSSVIEERTTQNAANSQKAFNASESGLRAAEEYLREMTARPKTKQACDDNCNIIWANGAVGDTYGGSYANNWWTVANVITNDTWWNTKTHSMPQIQSPDGTLSQDTLEYISNQPRFIVEELAYIPDDLNPNSRAKGVGNVFYQITSRGTGGEVSQNGYNPAQVYLQSIFGKRYN